MKRILMCVCVLVMMVTFVACQSVPVAEELVVPTEIAVQIETEEIETEIEDEIEIETDEIEIEEEEEQERTALSGCVTDEIYAMEDGDTPRDLAAVYPATTLEEAYVVRPTDHYKGAADPDFLVVEYGDFQCPACRAFAPITNMITEEFPDNVGIVFRHLPLTQVHPHAHKAAQSAEAAGAQGKFWAYHDALYQCQEKLAPLGQRDATELFSQIASDLSLDTEAFDYALTNTVYSSYIDRSVEEAVALGLQSTPSGLVQPFGQDVVVPEGLPIDEAWWIGILNKELGLRGVEQ